jgi:glycosyltransferase involved in cell wall biosynthesis
LVSAVVPYYGAARFVRETVRSLVAQSYPRLEVVLVVDGSFEDEDWVVGEIAGRVPVVVVSQMNQGLGAARNFGVLQSRGRYVLPLDADNVVAPEFVARCVEVLERRPEVAYVTSWSRYMEEDGRLREGPDMGYEPLGNQSRLIGEENVAGDAAAVMRRRLFDAGFRYSEELTSFEDWALYRRLREAGHLGAIIPERLLHYRVRADSMQAQIAQPNRARLLGEIEAHIQENAIQWTS